MAFSRPLGNRYHFEDGENKFTRQKYVEQKFPIFLHVDSAQPTVVSLQC